MGHNSSKREQDERFSLRRLALVPTAAESDGSAPSLPLEGLSGYLRLREGARLTLDLDPVISAHAIAPGDLVEVRAGRILYLGQVKALRGFELTIVLEHSVDIDLLEAIQRVWNRTAAGWAVVEVL
jgi:hypothetical protein